MTAKHLETGKRGEEIAVWYLQKNGFKILQQNFLCRSGEVDVIASQKSALHFIEVKSRTSHKFGSPFDAVNFHKRSRLARAAQYYLLQHAELKNYLKCFSMMSILLVEPKPIIEFIPNAFEIEIDYY